MNHRTATVLLLVRLIMGCDTKKSCRPWTGLLRVKKMVDSSSKGSWGAFTPVMPAFIRLLAGVIVLVIVEAVIVGFPGINNNITGTQLSAASIAVFMIGLVVCLIVLKFGTQLADAASDAYKNYKTWTPLLGYFFQIVAIAILYEVTSPIAQPYFGSSPWAFPLIFLLIALLPTIKVVVNLVHGLEGNTSSSKPKQNQNQY
jgi:hypothetical protein